MNDAFADTFKEAKLATTGGADMKHNKNVDLASTIMGVLASKEGDLISYFDKINKT